MTQLTTIARPYANAAFEYAREQKKLADWEQQLALLAAVAVDAAVARLLDNPALTREQRGELLLKICDKKLSEGTQNLVRLLAENNRLMALPDLFQQFTQLKAEFEGIVEATVLSAKKLAAAEQKKIIAALEQRLQKKVELNCEIDESLIGGAIIKAGDIVIDGSLKTRLNKLNAVVTR